MSESQVVDAIRDAALPLRGGPSEYDALMDLIGDARVVLLGEASHGTHEFYARRAEITRQLIAEKGFSAIVAEADWPDAYRVNCYVRGAGGDASAEQALQGFERFPTWMWRNTVIRDFVAWLRSYNHGRSVTTGFYGMDLYSLYNSIDAVVRYLDTVDPKAAARARERYACFEHFGRDSQEYGFATGLGAAEPCEGAAVAQLVEIQRRAGEYARRDGRVAEDDFFYAEQNARLAKNAEEYYRAMYRGRVSSWNLRDCHMAETLDALLHHLSRHGGPAKLIVWAHNSHLGDARATELGEQGELNVGQLVRQRYGDAARLIGFSTYAGTVTAASNWDEPPQRKRVRPGMEGSYEALFHEVGIPDFLLRLRADGAPHEELRRPRLERAIGVVYRPETERLSHYFFARLADQFDAVLHLDETRALEPPERTAGWEGGEAAETYPSAL